MMKHIRDKDHFIWQACRGVYYLVDASVSGVIGMFVMTISLLLVFVIIVSIITAPRGAMEVGMYK